MSRDLAAHVHVADDTGKMHVFGPDDQVPDWAAGKITNPDAWKSGKAPTVKRSGDAAELEQLRLRLAESEAARQAAEEQLAAAGGAKTPPPPRSGPGSGREAWTAYAEQHQVAVPDGANREQIIQLLDDAKVPTE